MLFLSDVKHIGTDAMEVEATARDESEQPRDEVQATQTPEEFLQETEEQMFVCGTCSQAFSNIEDCKQHMVKVGVCFVFKQRVGVHQQVS